MTGNVVDALFEAHVAFVVQDLSGPRLQTFMESRLDEILKAAQQLRLNTVVTRDMIKETARRYACELKLSVAVPELAGDIGRTAYSHPVHDVTRLGDLMPNRHLQEFIDKILELHSLRETVVREVIHNPLYANLAADIFMQGLRQRLERQSAAIKLPGARELLKLGKNILGKATPQLPVVLEETARELFSKGFSSLLQESETMLFDSMEDGMLRDAVLDLWQQLRQRTTGSFRDLISALDVEEFIVILYEYWHTLRQTEFYGAFIDSGIDAFFNKYGETSLYHVLQEVGITREMMMADAMRFGPHVIKVLKRKKLLEPLVRHELAPFYQSGQVEKVLAAHLSESLSLEPGKP